MSAGDFINFASAVAVGVLICIEPAGAQTADERISALEDKTDRILELLESMQAQSGGGAPTSPETPGEAVNQEPGASVTQPNEDAPEPAETNKTVLENGTSLKAFLVTRQSFETPQISDPVVAFIDKGADFTVGNFLATPASKTFEEHQMGVKWEGYVWIDTPGNYLFSTTCARRTGGGGSVFSLSLNGNHILKTVDNQRAPELGRLTIETPGAYYVEVWIGCRYAGHNSLSFSLEYSLVGAPKMEKISPATLYTKKEE